MLLSHATQLGLKMTCKYKVFFFLSNSSRPVVLGLGVISLFHVRCRVFFEPAVMPRSTEMVFWFTKAARFRT